MNLSYWKEHIADMPTLVDGEWVDMETGMPFKMYTKDAPKSKKSQYHLDKAVQTRQTAKALGAKALKGTAKQKAWAEQIRKEFLSLSFLSNEALELITQSQLTEHSKFWIETRNIDRKVLANAMSDLVVATRKANAIGEGNDGYKEQLAIRTKAMQILTV